MDTFRAALAVFNLSLDQFIVALLFFVIALQFKFIHYLYKRSNEQHQLFMDRYRQLDKLVFAHALILSNKLGVRTIKVHRSGDYEPHNPINETKG